MFPLRTRFAKEIVAEFLPPSRYDPDRPQKIVLLCRGMPGYPGSSSASEFLAQKGFFVIAPRYRGSWESGGTFLERSPEEDVRDIVGEIPKGIRDVTWGKRYPIKVGKIFIFCSSFGGPAGLLASRDPRIAKTVAFSPVTDWGILNDRRTELAETTNPSYVAYIHEAFGEGYRLPERNWRKLKQGKFYNPMRHAEEIDGRKILIFHASDDPVVRGKEVVKFAKLTGSSLVLKKRGGHLGVRLIAKEWPRIKKFLEAK